MTRRDEVSREQGVALPPSREDVEAMRAARAARIARDRLAELIPEQRESASESHRARVIASFAAQRGAAPNRPRPRHRCSRCNAAAHEWCRKSVHANRKPGFVHPEREDTPGGAGPYA